MPDIFNFSQDMKEYFESLPQNLRESIVQSGAKVNSLADLKAVAEGVSGDGTQAEN